MRTEPIVERERKRESQHRHPPDATSTYNTYIASQHCPVRDVSTNVIGFGFERRTMKALRLRPLFQSHKHIAESVIDSLETKQKILSIKAHEKRKLNSVRGEMNYQFAYCIFFHFYLANVNPPWKGRTVDGLPGGV